MKTYGENRILSFIMKFTFICIVIVISCSVCACNDLDIYSDLNYDFNKPKRLSDYERPNIYSKFRYPFDNILPDDYDESKVRETSEYETIPDKIRQFQEVIDWERSQLHKHRPHHDTPALRYYLNKLNNPERFHLKIPPSPRMEETRMYPSDEDIGFRIDEDKNEELGRLFEDPLYANGITERLIPNQIASESSHDHHEVHPNDENTAEFTNNRFNDIKVVEDPSEFAYPPSDPRFYRKIDEVTEKNIETTTKKEQTIQSKAVDLGSNKFLVNSRSDQLPVHGDRFIQGEITPKDGSIEVVPVQPNLTDVDSAGVYIIAIVAGISAAATVGLIAVGIGWYNLQKHVKNASDVEYPAYGVTGPNKDTSPSGDRRLAQSAQMYHYQHQKQQIIAMERAPPGERHGSVSEAESDEENEEGDYTVYECPGLAPTGEMEVKNPMFQDDPTPAQTPATKAGGEEKK